MRSKRYPEYLSPFLAELPERHEHFEELREEFLVDFGYHTSRAYWRDLEHLFDWADNREKDILELTTDDICAYLQDLKDQDYSINTRRRRLVTFRAFYSLVVTKRIRADCPTDGLAVGRGQDSRR